MVLCQYSLLICDKSNIVILYSIFLRHWTLTAFFSALTSSTASIVRYIVNIFSTIRSVVGYSDFNRWLEAVISSPPVSLSCEMMLSAGEAALDSTHTRKHQHCMIVLICFHVHKTRAVLRPLLPNGLRCPFAAHQYNWRTIYIALSFWVISWLDASLTNTYSSGFGMSKRLLEMLFFSC